MSHQVAVDNDALLKVCCYSLGSELFDLHAGGSGVSVLGTARFVLADRFSKSRTIRNVLQAKAEWSSILAAATELEPTQVEVDLATELEEFALRESLALDSGESLLCSIVIHRQLSILLTGDKRAIQGLELALNQSKINLEYLRQRVSCFEQLLIDLVGRLGAVEVRKRVCAEPDADKTASICFSCHSPDVDAVDISGLESYIAALRDAAPNVLLP